MHTLEDVKPLALAYAKKIDSGRLISSDGL